MQRAESNRARRAYQSPARLRFWVHTDDLPEPARQQVVESTWSELARAVPLEAVHDALAEAGISDMATPSVETIHSAIVRLRAVPAEPQIASDIATLRALLPKINDAALRLGVARLALANVAISLDDHDVFDRLKAPSFQIAAFMEHAETMIHSLPALPRQMVHWHLDAAWLASIVVVEAEKSGVEVGWGRPDRTGVRFVTHALRLADCGQHSASAVHKALQRSRVVAE